MVLDIGLKQDAARLRAAALKLKVEIERHRKPQRVQIAPFGKTA